MSVEATRVRDTLRERAAINRLAEVRLRDSSVSTGRIVAAEDDVLRLNVDSGGPIAREIPILYAQISRIRLDLGASRGSRSVGAILGVFVGGGLGGAVTFESADRTNRLATLGGMVGGGYLGYKLGARHRRRLVIEAR